MPTRLYLDTARLGLMSRSAQQIHIDFVRFVGEEGASLYFDQFLSRRHCSLARVAFADDFPPCRAGRASPTSKRRCGARPVLLLNGRYYWQVALRS